MKSNLSNIRGCNGSTKVTAARWVNPLKRNTRNESISTNYGKMQTAVKRHGTKRSAILDNNHTDKGGVIWNAV